MLLRLLLLFTVVPLVELVLLLVIADHTSWQFTLGLVLVTGIVGAALARWQGTNCVRRIHAQMNRGELPGDALLDALMILIAGALLITPGVMTDVVGFSLLTPPLRAGMKRWLRDRFVARMRLRTGFGHQSEQGPTTRGEQGPTTPGAHPQNWSRQPDADDSSPPGRDRIIDVRVIEPDDPKDTPPE
jgi:UPF0716 protein FxsA